MREPIFVPDLGVPKMALSVWYVKPGEPVFAGDRIVELLLGSATFDVAAPNSGTMDEHGAWPGDVLTPGQILGYVSCK